MATAQEFRVGDGEVTFVGLPLPAFPFLPPTPIPFAAMLMIKVRTAFQNLTRLTGSLNNMNSDDAAFVKFRLVNQRTNNLQFFGRVNIADLA